MNDSIIIKSNILMHPNDEDFLRRRILSQMPEGVVILPPYCEIVYPEYKVIEQIRDEIEHWESDDTQDDYQIGAMDMQKYVLRVIDKYKAKRSDKE